jgi:sulfatase maturation enzyme AslB (radical SAM superfamily)
MKLFVIRIIKKVLPSFMVKPLRSVYHLLSRNFDQTIPEEHRTPDAKFKYQCCEILHSRLTFEEDHLRPHCWRNSGDFLPKYPYNGEALSRNKIIDYLNHISRTITKEPEKCEGCIRIYYDKKPQKVNIRKFKLKVVMLNQHRFWCNVKCSYCFWLGRKELGNIAKPYSAREAIEFLFNSGMIDESCIFSWGGGESTILPEFDSLARLICDRGHQQILNTNGSVFSEAWAYVLSKDERTYYNTSVDSGTAETYKKIKSVDYFDQVWENINKYLAAAKCKGSFKIKYIVMACNRDHAEIEKFISKCLDAGVQTIEFSVDGGEIQDCLSEETIAAVAYLRALALKNNISCENAVFWDTSVAQILDNYPLPKV